MPCSKGKSLLQICYPSFLPDKRRHLSSPAAYNSTPITKIKVHLHQKFISHLYEDTFKQGYNFVSEGIPLVEKLKHLRQPFIYFLDSSFRHHFNSFLKIPRCYCIQPSLPGQGRKVIRFISGMNVISVSKTMNISFVLKQIF